MRFTPILAISGLAASHAIEIRAPEGAAVAAVAGGSDKGDDEPWHPHTREPHFFNLRVNDRCKDGYGKETCPFDSFAIRLEKGILVATPYNQWWDPKLPTFFVDDDTQLYTVSDRTISSQKPFTDNLKRSARTLSSSTSTPSLVPSSTPRSAGSPRAPSPRAGTTPATTRSSSWATAPRT